MCLVVQLLGVTGVRDKLQKDAGETVKFLMEAGIRVWMLTGDNLEYAIYVAYSSQLIGRRTQLFRAALRNKGQKGRVGRVCSSSHTAVHKHFRTNCTFAELWGSHFLELRLVFSVGHQRECLALYDKFRVKYGGVNCSICLVVTGQDLTNFWLSPELRTIFVCMVRRSPLATSLRVKVNPIDPFSYPPHAMSCCPVTRLRWDMVSLFLKCQIPHTK